ncbi:hypothetical protein H8E88_21320 [candidate division KSB1 bacterium]|nr:hypothetical protein [candidate division KSB1 bacterium]MBL7093761.1 hypothetical protein [candidate division KSB1 bacterium]
MAQTTLLIDGHIHLYPVFDLIQAIKKGRKNLLSNAKKKNINLTNAVPVLLLVERSDTNFFDELANSPEKYNQGEIKFVKAKDNLTIKVEKNSETILYIFAGRQLVTSENLEALSLISDYNVSDKEKNMDEIIPLIKNAGGITALNWAPGKWFGNRGKIINEQIEKQSPENIYIGETTMRPTVWLKPKLIKKAEQKGFRVMAGSDPLPFKGEENEIGSFGFTVEGEFDPKNPAQSMRNIFSDPTKKLTLIGKRNNIFKFSKRQYKIMGEKKEREK